MTFFLVLLFALLIGVVAGLRAMTAPAVVAWAGALGWINLDDARRWLDDLVVYVVSPLDAENQAEIELTEYHEAFVQWLVTHGVQHVRVA
jgi:hypothetical protein